MFLFWAFWTFVLFYRLFLIFVTFYLMLENYGSFSKICIILFFHILVVFLGVFLIFKVYFSISWFHRVFFYSKYTTLIFSVPAYTLSNFDLSWVLFKMDSGQMWVSFRIWFFFLVMLLVFRVSTLGLFLLHTYYSNSFFYKMLFFFWFLFIIVLILFLRFALTFNLSFVLPILKV